MNENAKIIKTKDGTDTLYLPDINEHYHSTKGARQESQYVYIKRGLEYWVEKNKCDKVRILEVGFGTGINALLTLNFARENNLSIDYISLEPFPLKLDLITQLEFNFKEAEKQNFLQLHQTDWEEKTNVFPNFNLTKRKIKLEDFEEDVHVDIVYFDAFAPSKQKDIWDLRNFLKLKKVLSKHNGILVTYCAQGQFKRNAKELGFKVTSLDGPVGKNEMIRLSVLEG